MWLRNKKTGGLFNTDDMKDKQIEMNRVNANKQNAEDRIKELPLIEGGILK